MAGGKIAGLHNVQFMQPIEKVVASRRSDGCAALFSGAVAPSVPGSAAEPE